jgi:hypothetical protein
MKIGDIIGKSISSNLEQQPLEQPQRASETDLRKQREDIERELAKMNQQIDEQDEVVDKYPQPQQQQRPVYNQPPQPQMQRPQQQYEEIEEQVEEDPIKNFKFNVILDNGQKLPIIISSRSSEIKDIIDAIKVKIEAGRVITLGDFIIPGNKILFMDLAAR